MMKSSLHSAPSFQKASAHAWRLIAFSVLYIFMSYMLWPWSNQMPVYSIEEYLPYPMKYYARWWESAGCMGTWLGGHFVFFCVCIKYYHTGSPLWGGFLVASCLLCSSVGAYYAGRLIL